MLINIPLVNAEDGLFLFCFGSHKIVETLKNYTIDGVGDYE